MNLRPYLDHVPVLGERVYVDPAEALEMALALTPAVRLDHSYLPNDFTLCLDKVPAWERSSGGPDEKSL